MEEIKNECNGREASDERQEAMGNLKNTEHFIIAPYKEIKEKAIPIHTLLLPLPFHHMDNKILEILKSIPLAWVEAYSFRQDKRYYFLYPGFTAFMALQVGRLVIPWKKLSFKP